MPDQKSFYLTDVKKLFKTSSFIHLRLGFSVFLLPVFLFAISSSSPLDARNTILIFLILHFFIYPASNAYNSYMDKDKGSIATLEFPPLITKNVFYLSIVFDFAGLMLSLWISYTLFLMVLTYVAVSKAYSWNRIRLKKYPFLSWITVSFFQGGFTFMIIKMCIENDYDFASFSKNNSLPIIASSLLVGALYPLTQIYQHKEDFERGDITLSYRLGYSGTFIFSAVTFLTGLAVLFLNFQTSGKGTYFSLLIFFILPLVGYFLKWYYEVIKNSANASFSKTMKFNLISSICLASFFVLIFILKRL